MTEPVATKLAVCVLCGHAGSLTKNGFCYEHVLICDDPMHGTRGCGCKCVFSTPEAQTEREDLPQVSVSAGGESGLPSIVSGGESLVVFEIMQRFRTDGSCEHLIKEALENLANTRTQPAGTPSGVDLDNRRIQLQLINDKYQDWYKTVSDNNERTAAVLMMDDIRYLLQLVRNQAAQPSPAPADEEVARGVIEWLCNEDSNLINPTDAEEAITRITTTLAEARRAQGTPTTDAKERAREIVREYAKSQGDFNACPHCGEVWANEMLLDSKRVPTHDFPKPCRQVCPGSGCFPVEDFTPLIDRIASAIAAPDDAEAERIRIIAYLSYDTVYSDDFCLRCSHCPSNCECPNPVYMESGWEPGDNLKALKVALFQEDFRRPTPSEPIPENRRIQLQLIREKAADGYEKVSGANPAEAATLMLMDIHYLISLPNAVTLSDEVDWESSNARRHELIESKTRRALTAAETNELAELQGLAGLKRESLTPRFSPHLLRSALSDELKQRVQADAAALEICDYLGVDQNDSEQVSETIFRHCFTAGIEQGGSNV